MSFKIQFTIKGEVDIDQVPNQVKKAIETEMIGVEALYDLGPQGIDDEICRQYLSKLTGPLHDLLNIYEMHVDGMPNE